jgi:hypothetical protein
MLKLNVIENQVFIAFIHFLNHALANVVGKDSGADLKPTPQRPLLLPGAARGDPRSRRRLALPRSPLLPSPPPRGAAWQSRGIAGGGGDASSPCEHLRCTGAVPGRASRCLSYPRGGARRCCGATGGTPSSSAAEVETQGGGPGYGGGGAPPSEAGRPPRPRRQALCRR